MPGAEIIRKRIEDGWFDKDFQKLYGPADTARQRERYKQLVRLFQDHFEGDSISLFSTPGRTELGGNHTDHNYGRVLAASVHLDTIAAAAPAGGDTVTVVSAGFPRPFTVDLKSLEASKEEEGTTTALIRGIAAGLSDAGYRIGGFQAYITSSVLPGSGLSSSASVEVLIGTIFSVLWNNGQIPAAQLAEIGQYAENCFFGKPCGLMDQIACAVGGITAIDFQQPDKPEIKRIFFDFEKAGYTLSVIDTGGSHHNLTSEYTAIFQEMASIAGYFGKSRLREVVTEQFYSNMPDLRARFGDRAVLRAVHFFSENSRVPRQIEALRSGELEKYLTLVRESGDSSWKLLQNCYVPDRPKEQPVPVAILEIERLLQNRGAIRIHGGGFAGTVQAYIPTEKLRETALRVVELFGENALTPLRLRDAGTVQLGSN